MATARDFAFGILRRWAVLHEPPFVPERGDPAWQAVPDRQRGFALDLLTGVIRWRNALDAVIASRLKQPIETLDIAVRAALWVGAYQLLFQGGTADYAAVDTTVTLVRRVNPKAAGLVNAVLRGITRMLPRRVPINKAVSPEMRLMPRALALDFGTQLVFNANVFPNPVSGLTSHLAAVRSHPALFVDHLRRLYGDARAAEILLRNNQRPVVTLRVDAAELDVPAAAGLVTHGEAERFLVAAEGWNEVIERLVAKGTLSPQDPTSAQPVRAAAKLVAEGKMPPPRSILDLCAGLGTKTIQLARAFPEAVVTAMDIDAEKLRRLAARAKQVKQANIVVASSDGTGGEKAMAEERFDLVMVDVPCSNTGVMAKRVQSRWRWPTLDHLVLAELQMNLLRQGASLLAANGMLVYSTCSIDPAENEKRVEQFLADHGDLRLLVQQSTLPSLDAAPNAPHDGGYFATMISGR